MADFIEKYLCKEFQSEEGREEGSTCNRRTIAGGDTTLCDGTMELKILDFGPSGQEAYLECTDCGAKYP